MSRKGITLDRMGARVRIGKINDDIDYTPYQFQQEGIIETVARPEELRRGIVGYKGRRTITFSNLKENNLKNYKNKINELEQKKKSATPEQSKIYKEAQEELKKYSNKVQQATKLQDVIPFQRANEVLGQYVNFKSSLINEYENRIKEVQNKFDRAKRYEERIIQDRRKSTGEERIRLTYLIREERYYMDALKKEMSILGEYKNKNLNQIKLGEELQYYPADVIGDYAKQVRDAEYQYKAARLNEQQRRALQKYKSELEKQKQQQQQKLIDLKETRERDWWIKTLGRLPPGRS